MSSALSIDALLDDPEVRILVCCGSGGVGKTTIAAATALRAAERGRRAVVLTIDPARRLAQSMGLAQLENDPLVVAGVDTSKGGSLHAMTLDMKRTFDEIVEAHAEPDRVAAILDNPFYQSLSSSFAGTQEYMAMEKLGQLHAQALADGRWDLIVVDTPPSRSALDFLDAPARLGSFLDGPMLRVLAAPARTGGRAGLRALNAGVSFVTGTMSRILGAQFLSDVSTFVSSLDSLFGGFRQRADATYQLLQGEHTRFLVVATPEADALREADFFVQRLSEESMPLAGLIVNRTYVDQVPDLSADRAAGAAEHLEESGEQDAATLRTVQLLREHVAREKQSEREQRITRRFAAVHPRVPVTQLPALADDVHDLEGLRVIGEAFD